MRTLMYSETNIKTHTQTHGHTDTQTHTHTYTHTHSLTHTDTHTLAHRHTHIHMMHAGTHRKILTHKQTNHSHTPIVSMYLFSMYLFK